MSENDAPAKGRTSRSLGELCLGFCRFHQSGLCRGMSRGLRGRRAGVTCVCEGSNPIAVLRRVHWNRPAGCPVDKSPALC